MKSPKSNYTFSQVPSVVRPRSTFDRSRYYKSAFNAGYLIPFFFDEVLPGDTFTLQTSAFARLSTLICPFMDNLYLDFFFFFVPNRLVWENWERFCGAQDNPGDSTDFLIPQVAISHVDVGSIYDYFGLPLFPASAGKQLKVSSLPFRCYNLIWNEFFRDENLQDSIYIELSDGPDVEFDFNLLRRGKRKSDPFTSALPWPQKGPGVELPLGGSAPVAGSASVSFTSNISDTYYDQPVNYMKSDLLSKQGLHTSYNGADHPISGSVAPVDGDLYADLSHATAVTINSLREAFQVQKWYEQLARGGSRYLELCLSMFGTHTGDARLQRPEYLGGGSTPIQVHSVAQSSATDDVSPQANLAAYGIAGANGIGFSKSFVEHGHILGLVSVRGDYGYQQGVDRIWSRRTKFDFYWPAFAHLGEVPVLNKEIFWQGTDVDDQAFGYQERWYEYRYGVNHITGALRSTAAQPLDMWHLATKFNNLPTLAPSFIQENPPVNRVLAVQDEPQFIFDSVIKCRCARVMPVYSVPGLVDHF